MNRARKLGRTAGEAEDERKQVLRVARESPKVLHQIVCRKRDRLVLTPPEQIWWFQVEDGVVKAHTASDAFTVNYQLGELEASLPAEVFFRARREVLDLAHLEQLRIASVRLQDKSLRPLQALRGLQSIFVDRTLPLGEREVLANAFPQFRSILTP